MQRPAKLVEHCELFGLVRRPSATMLMPRFVGESDDRGDDRGVFSFGAIARMKDLSILTMLMGRRGGR